MQLSSLPLHLVFPGLAVYRRKTAQPQYTGRTNQRPVQSKELLAIPDAHHAGATDEGARTQ